MWRMSRYALPSLQLSQAVTGLAAVAGLPLDGLHVHLVPCAVVGALYNGRQQVGLPGSTMGAAVTRTP